MSRLRRRPLGLARRRLARSVAGIDPAADVARFTDVVPAMVFDVGAWVGETIATYRAAWPGATVHAFEPATASRDRLRARFARDERVQVHDLALGAADGTGTLRIAADSSRSSLRTWVADPGVVAEQPVAVRSIDSFCAEHGIERIDYLKIDAEGADLDVVRGAGEMLTRRAVGFVQVEAAMNPSPGPQAAFGDFVDAFTAHGYPLFGLYEQIHEIGLAAPHLRRADCVFVSPEIPLGGRYRGWSAGS